MSKSILKFGIPAVLLILFVVLTAVLCSSTVFHGTYSGENPLRTDRTYEVVFGDNTVTYTVRDEAGSEDTYFGFYKRNSDEIQLKLIVPDRWVLNFKRKNVFTIVMDVGPASNTVEMELHCHGAIWLQIFYSLGTVASATVLIMQILQQRKQQDNT